VRQGENDGEHIWLRQSVTFTTNGQTRTVEIAIPLRPGATADEVEVLLSEADAGMERLARHLDARIASALGTAGATPTAPAPAPALATTPALAAGPAAPQGDSSPATSEQELRAPAPEVPLPSSPAAARVPTPAAPAAPPAATPATAQPARAPQAESPARPAPSRSAAPPVAPRERSAAPLSAVPAAAEIARPEFLAAIRDLGMDARQAMQQLGVRSLEGLNLREALEALRRQNLRGDEPEPAAAAPAQAAAARTSQPAVPPRYFEEEDEPEITFMVDGTPPRDADDFALAGDASSSGTDDLSEDELDELDLDDVPDFAPPSSRAAPAPAARAASKPVARHDTADSAARVSAVPSGDETGAAILARLREATGGGAASGHQRTAYGNIIVRELGEANAAALIRGVWRVPPERIGPEQMAELLSWGKRDTFGDEVALVLAELRAERDRAQANEEPGAPRPNGAGPAPRPRGGARPANRAGGS
jgi:hypothetical protein